MVVFCNKDSKRGLGWGLVNSQQDSMGEMGGGGGNV